MAGRPSCRISTAGGAGVLPADVGDVLQAHQATLGISGDDQALQCLHRFHAGLGLDLQPQRTGPHVARRADDVLRAQRGVHLVQRNPELGRAGPRDLHEQRLVALAQQRDPRHAGHKHQLPPQEVGVVVKLPRRVAVAGDGVEEREHIAEITHHHRLRRARRQGTRDVGDLAAQLVPHLIELGLVAREGELGFDPHQGLAGARDRGHRFDLLHLLRRAFDQIGDLLGHLRRRRAGVGGDHHRLADDELRVLEAPQALVGHVAAHQH